MFWVGTLVSPIEGLKQLICRNNAQRKTVGTLVSPIEGLKLLSPGLLGTIYKCRNACKPD